MERVFATKDYCCIIYSLSKLKQITDGRGGNHNAREKEKEFVPTDSAAQPFRIYFCGQDVVTWIGHPHQHKHLQKQHVPSNWNMIKETKQNQFRPDP